MRNFEKINNQKLGKRLCKQCKVEFQKTAPLQSVCTPQCALDRSYELNKKKREKEDKIMINGMKINTHSKENRKYLQNEINKLARMIDAKFGYKCIDCCGRPYGKQIDAAHFHSVGSNSSLRYNLHNIHSADSHCNNYSNTHISGYKQGLIERYGGIYLHTVESLPLIYKDVKLNNNEVHEKLIFVRKLIRTFNTYTFKDGNSARQLFNQLIGIYK